MAIIQFINNFYKRNVTSLSIIKSKNIRILSFNPLIILSFIIFFSILFFVTLNLINSKDKDNRNKYFMLLCGFEKFDNYFVRIDILERLFMQIINSGIDEFKEIKLVPEMLNLLGCSKENFKRLIQKMNYKITEKKRGFIF